MPTAEGDACVTGRDEHAGADPVLGPDAGLRSVGVPCGRVEGARGGCVYRLLSVVCTVFHRTVTVQFVYAIHTEAILLSHASIYDARIKRKKGRENSE